MEIKIGNANEYFAIFLPEKLCDDPTETTNQWNSVNLRIKVGLWKGEIIGASMLTCEIRDFLRSLSNLIHNLKGTAELKSITGWVDLSVEIGLRGEIEIHGKVRDSRVNTLDFWISSDQSFFYEVGKNIDNYLTGLV